MLRILKSLVAVVGMAGFIASGPLFAAEAEVKEVKTAAQSGAQAYIHEFTGDVMAAVGSGKPEPVQKSMHLLNNTTVTTGPKSYAVIKFEDGTVTLLKENTSFQIQDYTYNVKQPEKSNALFNMVRGGMKMITGAISTRNRDALKVATPIATIGIRGTEFLAELVNPLNVVVIAGSVSVTNSAGLMAVAAGQGVSVPSAAALGAVGPAAAIAPITMPAVVLPAAIAAPLPLGPVVGAGVAGGVTAGAIAVGAAAAAAAAAASRSNNTPAATSHK
jgi:hypothetical protein